MNFFGKISIADIFVSLCHSSQARTEQPADGEEGGGEVNEEEGEGGDEDVEVELGGHPAALVPAAVYVAEHSNLVAANIDQLGHLNVSDQLCLLLQIQVVPVHQLTDPTEGEVASNEEGAETFEDSSDEVGFEEGGVVLERLPHFHSVDRVLHPHLPRALLHRVHFYLPNIVPTLFRADSLWIFGTDCQLRRCEMRLRTARNGEKKSVNLEPRR